MSSHGTNQPHYVVVEQPTNSLGLAAFILSLVAFLSAGCLSPIALILSIVAMQKRPKDLAIAGLVLSILGCIPGLLIFVLFIVPAVFALFVIGVAASDQNLHRTTEAPAPPAAVAPIEAMPSATISKIAIEETTGGDKKLTFMIKNESNRPITHISFEVDVVDYNGESLAKDTFDTRFPSLEPGQTKRAEMRLARYSQLQAEVPSTAKPKVTITSVE